VGRTPGAPDHDGIKSERELELEHGHGVSMFKKDKVEIFYLFA
jgi:hypothetical protein